MKRIYSLLFASILILSLSVSVHAEASYFPLITSGYTEDGTFYEVHGEICSQHSTDSQYVTRYVTYSGKVTVPAQLDWTENINGVNYTGTLSLIRYSYNKIENKTNATYAGTLTAQ